MMLTLMLTSKGVAGVPRAALVILTATLTTLRSAARGRGDPARHRSAARHGPDGRERHGQLHRHRRSSRAGKACSTTSRSAIAGGLMRAHRHSGRSRMRIAVTGAGGQLGQAMVRRLLGAARPSRRSRAPISIHRRHGAWRAVVARDRIRTRSSTARPTTRWTVPKTTCSAALDGNAFGVQALARAAAAGRRGARALQHGLRVRRRLRPAVHGRCTGRAAERLRAVEAAGRVVRARRAAALRAARREPVRRAAAAKQHRPDRRRRSAPATRRACSRIASCRRPSSRMSAAATEALLERQRRSRPVSLREQRRDARGTSWRREIAGMLGGPAAARARDAWPMCRCGPAAAVLRLVERQACRRRRLDADLAGRAQPIPISLRDDCDG